MRILSIRLGAIGDVVMTLPALAGLKQAFPQATLDHLVEEASQDVVKGLPFLQRVIVVPRKRITEEAARLQTATWRRVRAELRAERYDLVVDFHNLLRSALWAQAVDAPRKVVRANWRELSPMFFNERIPYDRNDNAVRQHFSLSEGVAGRRLHLRCVTPPFDAAAAHDALARLQIRAPFCAIVPGSRSAGRALPERLVRASVQVVRDAGLVPLLVGGERESAPLFSLGADLGIAVSTDLPLRALAGLLRAAALVISSDSGPLHYADMLQRPVVGVFGPSSPTLFAPVFAPSVCLRGASLRGNQVRVAATDANFAGIDQRMLKDAVTQLCGAA